MGIKIPKATLADLQNPTWWARWLNLARVEPSDGSVADDAFASRQARSVIGRAGETAGAPADIVAEADGRFLARRSGVLAFDALLEADIPGTIARDTEVTAAANAAQAAAEATAAGALSDHEAAADPHPSYTTAAELSAAIAAHTASSDNVTDADLAAVSAKLPTVLGDYADDTAAATGGIAVGGMYHTSGAVKIRLS